MVFGPSLEELFTLNEVVEHCRLSLFELGQLGKLRFTVFIYISFLKAVKQVRAQGEC
jgi:hypothetical protein